jgi:hypothetical protein
MTEHREATRDTSIVQVARYIAGVGEGNKFRKLDLFAAVPGVSQADRRMRDLRAMDWEIDNSRINRQLAKDEYQVVKLGVRIDLGEKAPRAPRKNITGPKRRRIFERDGYACQICGIGSGQDFPDQPGRKAVLTVGHVVPGRVGGTDDDSNLRVECQRCAENVRHSGQAPPAPELVLERAVALSDPGAKRRLYRWMQEGHRRADDAEAVFGDWTRLPERSRVWVTAQLAAEIIRDLESGD